MRRVRVVCCSVCIVHFVAFAAPRTYGYRCLYDTKTIDCDDRFLLHRSVLSIVCVWGLLLSCDYLYQYRNFHMGLRMCDLKGMPLHQSKFASVGVVCPPELTGLIAEYFKGCGFDTGRVTCFSADAPDKLGITFELLARAREFAGVIMGLLNRHDLEIELNLCTRDDEPKAAKIKLRNLKDVEACERLIDKLATIVVTPSQNDGQTNR